MWSNEKTSDQQRSTDRKELKRCGVDDLDRLSTSGNLHVVEQRHEEDQ